MQSNVGPEKVECPICFGWKNILTEKGYTPCQCVIREKIWKAGADFRIPLAQQQFMIDNDNLIPFKLNVQGQTILKSLAEEMEGKHAVSNPIIVMGNGVQLNMFRFALKTMAIRRKFDQIVFPSGYDLVDKYFNDPKEFQSLLFKNIVVAIFGGEVNNRGAVKTVESMVQAFMSGVSLPVFMTMERSVKVFVGKYPEEMASVVDQMGVKELSLYE